MGMESDNIVQARARAAAGDLQGALSAVDVELQRNSRDPNLRIFRARLLQSLGHIHDAVDEVKLADRGAVSARFLAFRAELEEAARLLPEALETLTRALRLDRDAAPLRARRALMHQSFGDFDAARADLEFALKKSPNSGQLLFQLANLTRFDAETPLLERLQVARRGAKDGTAAAFHLDFALARAMDQVGRIEASFAHLDRANAAMRKAYPYDVTARQALVNRYQRIFRDLTPSDFWGEDSSDFAPIFVTGMPRSGTTLLEQVISSHAQVDAAGETGLFFKAVQAHIGDPMTVSPSKLALSKDGFAATGRSYARALKKLINPSAPYVTDKSLQTTVYMGLVLAALPKAHVVVVKRNPHAVALSNYRHMFRAGKQLFSYNLRDIAIYQATFDAMLDFWSQRCGDGFSEVSYEDLVRDPQKTTPQIIDRAGLDWDPACLRPEDNARPVMTLSASEVRQPIHTNSVDAWRRYETYLS